MFFSEESLCKYKHFNIIYMFVMFMKKKIFKFFDKVFNEQLIRSGINVYSTVGGGLIYGQKWRAIWKYIDFRVIHTMHIFQKSAIFS